MQNQPGNGGTEHFPHESLKHLQAEVQEIKVQIESLSTKLDRPKATSGIPFSRISHWLDLSLPWARPIVILVAATLLLRHFFFEPLANKLSEGIVGIVEKEMKDFYSTAKRHPIFQAGDIGIDHVQRGRFLVAVPYLDEGVAREPDRPDFRYSRALALFRLKNYTDALRDVNEAIRLEPVPQHFILKGEILLKTSDYSNAVVSLEKAVSLDPLNFDTRYLLAAAYAKANNKQKALDELQRLVSNDVRVALRIRNDASEYFYALKDDPTFKRLSQALGPYSRSPNRGKLVNFTGWLIKLYLDTQPDGAHSPTFILKPREYKEIILDVGPHTLTAEAYLTLQLGGKLIGRSEKMVFVDPDSGWYSLQFAPFDFRRSD